MKKCITIIMLEAIAILIMALMIGELQTELKKPKGCKVVYEPIYIDQWGNAYDFVKEK